MKLILDETWKEVLDVLRGYEITEATLKRKGDAITLEEMNESHVVLVRAELQGTITGDSEPDGLGVNVEKLFWILKGYGTPCQAEVRDEDGEITVASPDGQHNNTLSIKEPPRGGSPDLSMEHNVEAEGVNIHLPLQWAEKTHGTEGFHSTIAAESGKLLLEYWTEDSVDGARSVLGEAKGDGASSTYSPALLEPLKGEWNVKLGTSQPLKSEKVIDGGEDGWKADLTVLVAPTVKDVEGR